MAYTDDQYNTMAIQAIRGYKRFPFDITDDEISSKYPLAIPLIIQNLKDYLAINKSVKEEKQGNRDTTYRDDVSIIDNSIVLLIGYPYASLF